VLKRQGGGVTSSGGSDSAPPALAILDTFGFFQVIIRVYDADLVINMSTGPKNNWGGRRDGSGRKKKTVTQTKVERMLSECKLAEEKYGISLERLTLEIAYGQDNGVNAPWTVRMRALERVHDMTGGVMSEGSETDKVLGPQIYLPEQRPDPAKVLPIRQGKSS
jgi:hypothetical protein